MSDQEQPPQEQREIVYVQGGGSGMAVASLICGIFGAVIALIPILGIFGLGLGLVALILGLIGWSKARKGEAKGKGIAITGTIFGALALVLGIVGVVIVQGAFDQFGQDLEEIGDQLDEDLEQFQQDMDELG